MTRVVNIAPPGVIMLITPSDHRRGDHTSLLDHRTPHGALEKGSCVIILALTVTQFAYAAGGKGRPRPLHPRPKGFAPGNPNLMIRNENVHAACPRAI